MCVVLGVIMVLPCGQIIMIISLLWVGIHFYFIFKSKYLCMQVVLYAYYNGSTSLIEQNRKRPLIKHIQLGTMYVIADHFSLGFKSIKLTSVDYSYKNWQNQTLLRLEKIHYQAFDQIYPCVLCVKLKTKFEVFQKYLRFQILKVSR